MYSHQFEQLGPQSLKSLVRLQKNLNRQRTHAGRLLYMGTLTASCVCGGEWDNVWQQLRHASQLACESAERCVQNFAQLKENLPKDFPWQRNLSMDDFVWDASLRDFFLQQSCRYSEVEMHAAARHLTEEKFSIEKLFHSIEIAYVRLEKFLQKMDSLRTPKKRIHFLNSEFGDKAGSGGFGLPAGDPNGDRSTAGWEDSYYMVFGVVPGLIAAGRGLLEILNDLESEEIRKAAFAMNCNQINAASDDVLVTMIDEMLRGATGDEDEAAILHLLGCLPTERVRSIVGQRIGVKRILSDFDGEEWDQLMLLLRHHGLVGFQDWDDDASRLFINTNNRSTLNSLSLNDICTLIRNMFSGSCGDDDEQAIIRLLSSIDCARVRQLVSLPGFNVDDFDDNVDGGEWTQLKQLFRHCGIAV